MNQPDYEISSIPRKEPYVECIKRCLELWVPNHSEIHRSLKFTFDTGNFICDPSKIVTHVLDGRFDGLVGA